MFKYFYSCQRIVFKQKIISFPSFKFRVSKAQLKMKIVRFKNLNKNHDKKIKSWKLSVEKKTLYQTFYKVFLA